jgi:hypothetical protein
LGFDLHSDLRVIPAAPSSGRPLPDNGSDFLESPVVQN